VKTDEGGGTRKKVFLMRPEPRLLAVAALLALLPTLAGSVVLVALAAALLLVALPNRALVRVERP
jgi:hypothetical protein